MDGFSIQQTLQICLFPNLLLKTIQRILEYFTLHDKLFFDSEIVCIMSLLPFILIIVLDRI